MTRAALESRWPQIAPGSVTWAVYEPGSGALLARRAVQAVTERAVSEGAELRTAWVLPPRDKGRLSSLTLRGG